MDLKNINQIENAVGQQRFEFFRLGACLVFILGIGAFTLLKMNGQAGASILAIAAMIGGYMAMNIGANDVANNVGPAVGSKAL